MAKVLVSGGSGFIGAALVRRLVGRGDDVRIAARDPAVPDTLADLDVEIVTCDVRDRRAVRRALKDVDRVFHAAGFTSLRSADRARCFEVNVGGTKTLLEECLRAGVERVVYTSSAAAVGPKDCVKTEKGPRRVRHPPGASFLTHSGNGRLGFRQLNDQAAQRGFVGNGNR